MSNDTDFDEVRHDLLEDGEDTLDENDELYHHGVLGMKWGIRRYQPYGEGGYDPEHVGKFIGSKKEVRKYNRAVKKLQRAQAKEEKRRAAQEAKKRRILLSGDKEEIVKNQNLFSNEEYDAAIKRSDDLQKARMDKFMNGLNTTISVTSAFAAISNNLGTIHNVVHNSAAQRQNLQKMRYDNLASQYKALGEQEKYESSKRANKYELRALRSKTKTDEETANYKIDREKFDTGKSRTEYRVAKSNYEVTKKINSMLKDPLLDETYSKVKQTGSAKESIDFITALLKKDSSGGSKKKR